MQPRERALPTASSSRGSIDVVDIEGAEEPDSSRGESGGAATGPGTSSGGKDEAGDSDEDDEDGDEDEDEDEGEVEIKMSIDQALKVLEKELGTPKRLLRRNAKILYCDALFEESEEPRTVETLTRINSPTENKYIEVHFSYHSRSRMYSIEWFYTLGYKVFSGEPTPSTNIRMFEGRSHASTYRRQGWRSITYAFYDDENNHWRKWKHIEVFSVDVTHTGLVEVHEALWGPLAALPPDASAADLLERRRALVRTLRYTIACEDGEVDSRPGRYGSPQGQIGWVLEAANDRWLARGVRRACGFQLERDPDDEVKGRRDREEAAKEYDDDDDDDDDEMGDDDDDKEDEDEDEDNSDEEDDSE
ncbi:hypothetical protein BD779DRAFT_1518376 [Infundibulicybe gibba]|nr:hypothetical protein BD779DRAFT_1518376 [Infundibulicybe gibba]